MQRIVVLGPGHLLGGWGEERRQSGKALDGQGFPVPTLNTGATFPAIRDGSGFLRIPSSVIRQP